MAHKDKEQEERKSSQPETKKIEKRVFNVELRADNQADEESRTVVGYAALFDSPSEDMGYTEIIERDAFSDVMKDDVRALFNHDSNYVLARTASSTLDLSQDTKGLRFSFEMPTTTYGEDLIKMMQRGDVNQCSFAFSVKEHAWETVKDDEGNYHYTRRIKKFERLYDVSIVTYPAYPDTDVALRSLNEFRTDIENPPGEARSEGWADFFEAATNHYK